jgi:hypothetical protein
VRDVAELREALLVDPLDPQVDDPAAGEADLERVVVADPVPLQMAHAGLGRLPAQLVHRALDTAARDAAHRRPVGTDEHRRAGRAGRTAPGPDHGGHAYRLPVTPPPGQLRQHITHRLTMHPVVVQRPDHADRRRTQR